MTSLNEFQADCEITADPIEGPMLELATMLLGLTSEAGECADVVKKHIEQGRHLDYEHLREELGDTLYYVARVSRLLGSDLTEIAGINCRKRRERFPERFP